MTDTRRILRVNTNRDSNDLVEHHRGPDTVSGFISRIVEGDAKEPGSWDGATRAVSGKDAVATYSVSISGPLVPGLDRRRGDLSAAAYVSALLVEEAQLLKDGLASARGAQVVQEAQRRQGSATETGQRRKGHQDSRRRGTKGSSPRPRPRRSDGHTGEGKPARRRSHQRAVPPPQQERPLVDGRTQVEHRPHPRGETRLEVAPWATWEVRRPAHLQEPYPKAQRQQGSKRSKPAQKQQASKPMSADKPAPSSPAIAAAEKLAPPPEPSPQPKPTPSRPGSTEPFIDPPQPFGPQEQPMSQIPPRRPPTSLGARVQEKPQQDLDHDDLLALLRRHAAGKERFPALVIVPALDGEGGRLVHAAMGSGLRGPGDALRVVIGVGDDLNVASLVGPGVVEATWARLMTLLDTLAVKIGCGLSVQPYVVAVALDDSDDEDDTGWEWEDEYDEDDEDDEDDEQEDETQEVPCGHVLLASIMVTAKAGGPSHFPTSSMW